MAATPRSCWSGTAASARAYHVQDVLLHALALLVPLAQLLPAPPPWSDKNTFSGLNRLRMSLFWIALTTLHRPERRTPP